MDETFDLVWMQRMGSGTEVLRRGIPAADALRSLQQADQDEALSAPGGVCYLRPSGEQDADYWRIKAQDTLLELHQRETDVAALRKALDELYDDWQGPDTESLRAARLVLETTPDLSGSVLFEIGQEVQRADGLHAPLNSAHEAYAVLLEELDEFKLEVWKKRKQRDQAKMREELIQLSAMGVRAIRDLGL